MGESAPSLWGGVDSSPSGKSGLRDPRQPTIPAQLDDGGNRIRVGEEAIIGVVGGPAGGVDDPA